MTQLEIFLEKILAVTSPSLTYIGMASSTRKIFEDAGFDFDKPDIQKLVENLIDCPKCLEVEEK